MPNPGDQFGPYVLEDLLGRGAYGEVWKASRKGALLRVPLAMKLLTGAFTERDAFLQEAELWLKATASPYVVPVQDVGEDRGLFYFVSQFIDGGTLRTRIGFRTGTGLPAEEVVELVRGVLLGLEYLHAADVVHLDLKPDNVLLQQGVPRLADFGLARVLLGSYVRQADPLGTVLYQPPEAFNDQISRQWDVWSVGVMLYELLTGNPPFDAKTRNALVERIKSGQRTATPLFIPAPLREVIEGALQVERKARYAEPAVMRAALEAALQRVRTPPVRGADVPTDLVVTAREAARGCRKELQWGNRRVGVGVPKGAQANEVVTVPGEGMPGQAGGGPGDLLVRLVVLPEVRGPRPLEERINPVDGATMIYIPGGEFLMGSDPAEIEAIWKRFGWREWWKQYTKRESPLHRVEVSGFWLSRDLVTVRQYREFCGKAQRAMPDGPVWAPTWEGQDEHPVVNVSWEDATAYAAWAGGRLPTEAEWEYAARGGNTGLAGKPRHIFVWGDDLPGRGSPKVANLVDMSLKQQQHYDVKNWVLLDGYEDGFPFTSPVGSFPPNGFGLRDMAGNVWEWCADYYAEDYYRTCAEEVLCKNPWNKSTNNLCVARGGSGDEDPNGARVAYRHDAHPQGRYEVLGFRVGWPAVADG